MKVTLVLFGTLISSLLSAQDEAARFQTLFDRVDANEDGKVSKQELENAGRRGAWFDRVDRDRDGLVTREELRAISGPAGEAVPGADGKVEVVTVGEIPASAPLTRAGIEAAEQYSASHGGHSFLVLHEGNVVRESYANGWESSAGHRLASGTKSFSGVLLALAVKDQLLTPDEKVSATITEWQDDEDLAAISIRSLLNLTSGIEPGGIGRVPAYADAIEVDATSGPGIKFRYGPNAFQIFGEVIRRKLEAREDLPFADPLAYLEAGVFDAIGMTYTEWRRDENGMPHLPSGAFITAAEWGKFGQFLLQQGEWDGEVLIDQETLRLATAPVTEVAPLYGLTFWLLGQGEDEARPWLAGAYMAAGAGKQRLFVLPRVGTVVVRQGESRKFENLEFLDALFSLESGTVSVEIGE